MSFKIRHFLIIGLAILGAACSETQPTAVFRPTNSAATATPTPTLAAPTNSPTFEPTAIASPTISPNPEATAVASPTSLPPAQSSPTTSPIPPSPTVEPTHTVPPGPTAAAFPPVIGLEPWLTGFDKPLYLAHAGTQPPWDSRVFVVEKAGRIQLVENGQVQAVPFLNIVDRVGSNNSEQGLLSVAFPPDFDSSGMFFVNYTDRRGNTIVARYQLLEQDPPQGDPASEKIILEIAQPASNHNGGQLQFGPDGYLYIGTGDGGRAGDPWRNAQNPEELLGKMLRIDVKGADPYGIPSDNPFVNEDNIRSEIWALGLRNPWRFSFDRATNDLYIADVGQNTYEEVDFQPARSTGGENYGWDVMEGNHCFEPAQNCDSAGLILPVAEYDHAFGCSITGGYVYRGAEHPTLAGVYFFGDFCSGRIWGLRQMPSGEWNTAALLESDVAISSFGEDAPGELYVVGYADGVIYRLVAAP
jgi:glucose/arabinose dehydrogenase